jgi:hypothetical protein
LNTLLSREVAAAVVLIALEMVAVAAARVDTAQEQVLA